MEGAFSVQIRGSNVGFLAKGDGILMKGVKVHFRKGPLMKKPFRNDCQEELSISEFWELV